jgi:hypothetical protein
MADAYRRLAHEAEQVETKESLGADSQEPARESAGDVRA